MRARTDAESAARGFTFSELMVAAAAREIRDGELVFVGMRLPMLAFLVARRTHAPRAIGEADVDEARAFARRHDGGEADGLAQRRGRDRRQIGPGARREDLHAAAAEAQREAHAPVRK